MDDVAASAAVEAMTIDDLDEKELVVLCAQRVSSSLSTVILQSEQRV